MPGSTLTAKGRATRTRIVQGAADVLRDRGVAQTTLDDVMAQTRTSKSQLFHYFPGGKDELLLAVAQFEADRVLEDQQPQLDRLDSWEAWDDWRNTVVRRYEEQGDHCPLGALSLQIGRTTPGGRAIVVTLMKRWRDRLAAGIRTMQRAGHVADDVDAEETAAAMLAGLQGGVAILMATGDSTHLRAVLDWSIRQLRATVPAH
ncbi:TetR family transcriptional regulator [Streptomyces sp. NPDC026672]|uniref:TetR/AcrR family transcriptional regulator n=1 Tax=unclassified Streptomyces TaxID=2593676 RepID=UPI0033D9CD8E